MSDAEKGVEFPGPDHGGPGSETTPAKEEVVAKKAAPAEQRGPGFVILTDAIGRSVKKRVDNIGASLDELRKREDLQEYFAKAKGPVKVYKRESA